MKITTNRAGISRPCHHHYCNNCQAFLFIQYSIGTGVAVFYSVFYKFSLVAITKENIYPSNLNSYCLLCNSIVDSITTRRQPVFSVCASYFKWIMKGCEFRSEDDCSLVTIVVPLIRCLWPIDNYRATWFFLRHNLLLRLNWT